MSASRSGPTLRGRHAECAALDRVVSEARAGHGQVLVLRGDTGVGKSALLDYAAQHAPGCRILTAGGVESEMELPFAGLHQLCRPLLPRLEGIPERQRDALSTAFGLGTAAPQDTFFVGLAVLNLLADVAEDRPLICLVDDAQWLDHASALTLAFVARRLLAEPIALVFAARPVEGPLLAGLPELPVQGLGDPDARALLATVMRGPLDNAVRDRIVAESRGNALAILELAETVTSAEVGFGFGTPASMPLASRMEQGFLRRIGPLPTDTRQLLLTAALEPVGDVPLLWRAAALQGIGHDRAAPAVAAGLVEIGTRVRFRHPLVRSALCRAADHGDLRAAHDALAEATDPDADPARRAWHRSFAVPGPDEEVAAELERSADRASARGGLIAAAAFLQRSAELTLVPADRAGRLLAAAQAMQQAGAPEAAVNVLNVAEAGPLDQLQRARLAVVRGQIAFTSEDGRHAPGLLLAAAQRMTRLDATLARDTYLDALTAALFVGRLADGAGVLEVAEAAEAATRDTLAGSTRAPDLLLRGLALTITDSHAAGAPLVKRALAAFGTADVPDPEAVRWLWLAAHAAHDLWDDERWAVLSERHIRLAREVGALTVLPLALSSRIGLHLFAGELASAAALVDEVTAVTHMIGSSFPPYGALFLAARQGREATASALIRTTRAHLVPRGEGMGLTLVDHAEAVLLNGLGRYEEALVAAEHAARHPQELGFSTFALPELIEAASRGPSRASAASALERLTTITQASGTDWALGVEARSRALLSTGSTAEALFREAIERLGRTRLPMELARGHLVFGEWLRRGGRRLDAREHLRTAHDLFAGMGAEGFAERARHELVATGETVRKRAVGTPGELTPQEALIARLAAQLRTNPEIGAQLFISSRTVEWHLSKVFSKLGVNSRRELRSALPDLAEATSSA
jgi:DNA-binding CsgD family transcriptional regulator